MRQYNGLKIWLYDRQHQFVLLALAMCTAAVVVGQYVQ